AGFDICGVSHQSGANLRARRSRRAARRSQCRPLLRPPRPDGEIDGDALHHHHPQPDHHGADEPLIRCDHGGARRVAVGFRRSRRRRQDTRGGGVTAGSMRLPPDLPPDLKAGLARLTEGVSRKAIAERAAAQSRIYRAGGGSHRIAAVADVLAYAFARLPATYAAAAAVFNAVRETLPAFQPRTMLDVGAGPGTAAFAAGAAFG